MNTNQIVGVALIVVGVVDAILGAVLASRAANEQQQRVMRITFTVSAAVAVAAGLVFLLKPVR